MPMKLEQPDDAGANDSTITEADTAVAARDDAIPVVAVAAAGAKLIAAAATSSDPADDFEETMFAIG